MNSNIEADSSNLDYCNWFVAQLRPNQYSIAVRNLTRQGYFSFMPEIIREIRTGKGFKSRRQALFPGYLFVGINQGDAFWHRISSTRGVSRLVSFGGKLPVPIATELIEELRARTGTDGLLLPEPELRPGQEVVITRGPFSDFIAQVERREADARVWLLLEFLGHQTRVEVPRDYLKVSGSKVA